VDQVRITERGSSAHSISHMCVLVRSAWRDIAAQPDIWREWSAHALTASRFSTEYAADLLRRTRVLVVSIVVTGLSPSHKCLREPGFWSRVKLPRRAALSLNTYVTTDVTSQRHRIRLFGCIQGGTSKRGLLAGSGNNNCVFYTYNTLDNWTIVSRHFSQYPLPPPHALPTTQCPTW
jgi:hypothetical protein